MKTKSVSSRFRSSDVSVLSLLFAVFALTFPVFAITAPVVKAAGFINGHLNVCVLKTPIADASVELQMKEAGADDSEYVTIASKSVSALSTFTLNEYDGAYLNIVTNFIGTAALRIRAFSGDETGEWVEIGDLPAYANVVGTAIGTATTFANAVDGNLYTMIDESTNPWIGYDYGRELRIRGVRVFARPDLIARFNGAKIQCSIDTAFSEPVTVYTAVSSELDKTRVTEILFEEPLDVRCVRILSGTASNSRSSVCEFEVIPVDAPWYPELTVSYKDITNFWPKLSWTIDSRAMTTKVDVFRAISSSGPYTSLATDLPADAGGFVDETAKIGVLYYYKVTIDCNNVNFPGQTPSSLPCSYRRVRRLDRSWDDETQLYSGITVLKQTNGVSNTQFAKAFDGIKTSDNRVDATSAVNSWGPVGLAFPENVWVGQVGYICRWDNWCYVRIKNGALFCASGEDVALSDKIRCSEKIAVATQDDTFHVQASTYIPQDGAPWWFLYGHEVDANGFCGNVCELAFFGWSEQDLIDSGVVNAPESLYFSITDDRLGMEISWSAGANASSYRLERRARGNDVWTVLSTMPVSADGYTDRTITQGFWEYRMVAIGAEGDESASETFPCTYYSPGNGTGLRGSLYAPYAANNALMSVPSGRWDLPVGAVNITVPKGQELLAGSGVYTNAHLVWRGKIIVPMAGSYDFTLETSDGGAVYIDGVSVANSWTAGTKSPSGTAVLEAGEHEIEVDARLQKDIMGYVKCILRWGGTVENEVVPASQLIPAETALLECDGWNVRYSGCALLGKAVKTSTGYTLSASKEKSFNRHWMNYTFLSKPWRYSFDVSSYAATSGNGTAGIMARSSDGNLFSVFFCYNGNGYGQYGVMMVTNGTDDISYPVGKIQSPLFSNRSAFIRLAYNYPKQLFTAYWMDDGDTEWTKIWEWTNDGSIRGEFEYGFFVSGETVSTVMSGMNFSQISVKTQRPGVYIIFK